MPTNNFAGTVNGDAGNGLNYSLLHTPLTTEDVTTTAAITTGSVAPCLTFTMGNTTFSGGGSVTASKGIFNPGGTFNDCTLNGNVSGNGNFGNLGQTVINGNFFCDQGTVGFSGGTVFVNGNTILGATCVGNNGNDAVLGSNTYNGGFQMDITQNTAITPGILYNETGAKLAGIGGGSRVLPLPLGY